MNFFWLLALVGHAVLWIGLVNRGHAYEIPRWLVETITLVCGAALVGIPAWAAWLWGAGGLDSLWTHPVLRGYAAVMAVLAVAATLWRAWLSVHPERRGVLLGAEKRVVDFSDSHGLSIANPVPRLFCRVPGNQVLTLSIEEKHLSIPHLPPACAGLRVAHLSDLHLSGRFGLPMYRDLIDLTNESRPDLIALTGDLIEKDACHAWIADTYARLAAPLGVFYILGNHDKKCGHAETRRLLDAAGLLDASRASTTVEHHGAAIEIVGNELPWFGPPSEFTNPHAPLRLVLAHTPDQFGWAAERNAHLMLAGHNHGGQVRFPPLGAILSPSKHGARYNSGVFRRKGTVMHVTRGAGSLAPFR
ncbi:MAG: metallophosphoesterase, partial [Planctomycetales bacterium]|nr:metallophosphoesterase [Planctomycetales bacterium]